MIKSLCEITKQDIIKTCEKYSNNFTGDCDKNCPFYCESGFLYKPRSSAAREISHCKTTHAYIKTYPNDIVKLD